MKSRYHPHVFILIIAAIVVSAGYAASDEKMIKTFSVKSGQKLDIDLKCGGGVYIVGWDEDRVEVAYHESHGDLEYLDIDIKETRSGIKITADFDDRSIQTTSLHFAIKVPRKFDVDLFTAGGGMEFSGFEGNIEGKSRGGGIELEDMKGEVDLKTNGGGIEVTDCDLDGEIRTNGGGVQLENVGGNLRIKTNGGSLDLQNVRFGGKDLDASGDFDLEDLFGDGVRVSTGGGNIDVDGAPEGVAVTTGGGPIDVSNAAKIVGVRTGGGDIDIHTKFGRVEALTGAGDIEVVVDQSPGKLDGSIEIVTGTGDVTLTLPADFSAEFDIDLGYTKNSRRGFEIKSDFKIDLEHTDGWDSRNGSPRKHIFGTGAVKGGKHKIKIKTTNGDVRIIKK
ncbi:MAG: DUF4097 family beta strand repeat protein [Candidatus Krumholzibacteria bacterium]|nr:DUF4097 family beta strand repeat protein [Candidatus Krumholzibacteria bacterium]